MLLRAGNTVACDFFSKAIWTPFGKRQAFALMFIHVGSRKAWVSPTAYHPDTAWVQQQARNLLMWLEEAGLEATHLIHDRDTKFTRSFDGLVDSAGIRIVKSPVMAPNANAFAESWIATLKRECLKYFVCFSLRHADHLVQKFVDFYNEHRPHQGLDNRMIDSAGTRSSATSVGRRLTRHHLVELVASVESHRLLQATSLFE